MATRLKETEVVVIGLGAAGGVAVLPIAQAGIDVVALEAGTWLTRRDFAPDEIRNNIRDWPQAVQKCSREVPTHRPNASAQTTRAGSHPMMNAVGGTTLHYWAQSWRLNPWDFKVVSETQRRYGASRIPEGSTVEDWPFGYDELEPYYDKVEFEIGVSGQAGNVKGAIDRRGNVFEAPRQRDYPMPPLRSTGFLDLMTGAAASSIGIRSRVPQRSTRSVTRMEQWYRAAGAIDIQRGALGTMGLNTHAYGGTRMGDDRDTNVVNRWGFSHEVPNLGVLGASVMGTSGAHNPTLTVQALAWRTAEHLVENWKGIAGS